MKKIILLLLLLSLTSCIIEEKLINQEPEKAIETTKEPNKESTKIRNLYIEEGGTFHMEFEELPLGTELNIVNQDNELHHFTVELIQENKDRIIENYKPIRIPPGESHKFILDKTGELKMVDIWNAYLKQTIKVVE